MDYSVLETSSLFKGIPAKELRDDLEATPHHILCYDKEENGTTKEVCSNDSANVTNPSSPGGGGG